MVIAVDILSEYPNPLSRPYSSFLVSLLATIDKYQLWLIIVLTVVLIVLILLTIYV